MLLTRKCTFNFCTQRAHKNGRCSAHAHVEKGFADRAYLSPKWQAIRRTLLARKPLCIKCLSNDRAQPATEIDHILPRKEYPSVAWDKRNFAPLCLSCHGLKRSYENKKAALRFYEGCEIERDFLVAVGNAA